MKVVFENDPSMSNILAIVITCASKERAYLQSQKWQTTVTLPSLTYRRWATSPSGVFAFVFVLSLGLCFVSNYLVLYHGTLPLSPYHGHSVPQDHLSWISLHPATAPLSLGPQWHHGKCNLLLISNFAVQRASGWLVYSFWYWIREGQFKKSICMYW